MDNTTKEWWENEGEETKKGGFFKPKVGQSKCRILTQFEKVKSLYTDKYPNGKYVKSVDDSYKATGTEDIRTHGWAYVIDREDGEQKIATFSPSILVGLSVLKRNPDYAFDTWPMPYDITISNTGTGANRYSIQAARKNTDLTKEELTRLNKSKPIKDIIQMMKDKREGKKKVSDGNSMTPAFSGDDYPVNDIHPDEINFDPQ